MSEDALRVIEALRREGESGSGLDARLDLGVEGDEELSALLDEVGRAELARLLVVGEVERLEPGAGEPGQTLPALRVGAAASAAPKCDRCWIHRPDVEDGLCARCARVVGTLGHEVADR